MITVAATGHRPEKLQNGYAKETMVKLIDIASGHLDFLKPGRVLSGMALGWDQAVAIAAIRLDIPLTAVIPFSSQYTVWPEKSWFQYTKILCKADDIVVLCKGQPADTKTAAALLQKRNIWMMDRCEKVLALWNGDRSGGTYNAVKYAVSKRKPILNCWPDWLKSVTIGK